LFATFGLLFSRNSEMGSPQESFGDSISHLGAGGFVLAATFGGGHQVTFATMVIGGTILNTIGYFLVWLIILKAISAFKARRS